MEFWSDVLLSPIIIITALVIGTAGEVTKRLVRAKAGDKGWKGVFHVTLPAHPVIVGLLIGFIPWLPSVDALTKEGFELAGRVGTYALAGVLCKIGYDTLVSTVQRALRQKAAALGGSSSGSTSVPPPADS